MPVPVGGQITGALQESMRGTLALVQGARQQPRRAHGGFACVGVRVLAISDEGVGVPRHGGGEVGVQVEDAEDGQRLAAGHGADMGEQRALRIEAPGRDHRAVQRQPDAVEPAGGERRPQPGVEFAQEALEDGVVDGARGQRRVIHGRRDRPAFRLGDFEEAVDGRAVAAPLQQLLAAADAEIREPS